MSVCSDGASQGRIGIFAHVITVSGFNGNPNPFLPFIITPPLPTFSFAVMTARLAELLVPWWFALAAFCMLTGSGAVASAFAIWEFLMDGSWLASFFNVVTHLPGSIDWVTGRHPSHSHCEEFSKRSLRTPNLFLMPCQKLWKTFEHLWNALCYIPRKSLREMIWSMHPCWLRVWRAPGRHVESGLAWLAARGPSRSSLQRSLVCFVAKRQADAKPWDIMDKP